MWKISREKLYECVNIIVQSSKQETSNILDMIELQITLKNFAPLRNRRVQAKKTRQSVSNQHRQKLRSLGLPVAPTKARKNLTRNKKIKVLTRKYKALLSSETFMQDIPRLLNFGTNGDDAPISSGGPGQSNEGSNDRNKKLLRLAIVVGHVDMAPDELAQNLYSCVNLLIPLLKKQWLNVRHLHVKSTLGVAQKLY
ncbi:60S ribosomal protein L10a-like [Bicyclus anynana]|uniref:60S ribosomal protein L10a-like n=1 Tax=Bicyclus anynana TaxID=110368 RepID=A0A6J1N0R9_BICAN|nr:60S ribosomal protein L10a-like [Bicyclus anynana]